MKNRNREEEEEKRQEETELKSDDDLEKEYGLLKGLENLQDDKPFIPNVDIPDADIPDVKKDAPAIRKIIINDRKKSFKEIFDLPLKKNYGENSQVLLDKTRFEKEDNKNIEIYFKDKKIGNYKNNKLELFKRKNKAFCK